IASALRVTFSMSALPATVVTAASSISGLPWARRRAIASSCPGSQSRMMRRGMRRSYPATTRYGTLVHQWKLWEHVAMSAPTPAAPAADAPLAERGAARIAWIRSRMPLLAAVRTHFAETRPFAGHRIGMSLHLEPKTAVLLEVLAAGGAEIVATGNHGSTQDDVVAHLRTLGLTVHGRRDDSLEDHHANLAAVLDAEPDILLDNGADLAAGVVARGET